MGKRFPDMSEVYDPVMIGKGKELALKNKITKLKEGIYVSVQGPQLEIKAEYRMLLMLGADAVGMSTVPEVIGTRQMEIPVFSISVITDMSVRATLQKVEIKKILQNAAIAEPNMTVIFKELIAQGVQALLRLISFILSKIPVSTNVNFLCVK